VTAPTIWAPWTAGVILLVGLLASAMMTSEPKGSADFTGLAESEQGPLKI
jgi:hypothetical protein